jgi:hypothetical protein
LRAARPLRRAGPMFGALEIGQQIAPAPARRAIRFPPIVVRRQVSLRPSRLGSGSPSYIQLNFGPVRRPSSRPGMRMLGDRSHPPASTNRTRRLRFSDRRAARVHPALPAPMMMWSQSSCTGLHTCRKKARRLSSRQWIANEKKASSVAPEA